MDPLIQQSIVSLVELSRYRLGLICHHLVNQLETISKQGGMVLEDYVPYDVMQSQLFVLRILSQCMEAHWKAYRDQLSQHVRETSDHDNQENGINGNVNDSHNDSSAMAAAAARQSDPPPLDEALAKYVLSVLTRFLHDTSATDEPAVPTEVATNNNSSGSKKKPEPEPAPASSTQSVANFVDPDIANELYKAAGRILFYIGASNWPIVFARLKARVQHLSTTNDEWPETAELKLLETANLNQRRLGQVLT
ncbi:Ras GTPase activating protein ira2, partial [Podila epigama]